MNNVCRIAYYHLRSNGSIRRYLSEEAAKSLVHGLVTSRLDYCNALLVGLPNTLIRKLQLVQNTAARVVARTPKRQHITPVLYQLHWLPVQARIEYKVLLYVYKALTGAAPQYIADLIQQRSQPRTIRSSGTIQLVEPRVRTKSYGHRTFRCAAAKLWNSLPSDMRTITTIAAFKKSLKTHYFRLHYH